MGNSGCDPMLQQPALVAPLGWDGFRSLQTDSIGNNVTMRWIRRAAIALGLSLAACGDGLFIISVNSGVIVGNPACRNDGGQFQLHDQGGLTVLVVITSNTKIIVAGTTGTCFDLMPNASIQVSGHQNGDQLVAGSITAE
jgi:hypothetical protein